MTYQDQVDALAGDGPNTFDKLQAKIRDLEAENAFLRGKLAGVNYHDAETPNSVFHHTVEGHHDKPEDLTPLTDLTSDNWRKILDDYWPTPFTVAAGTKMHLDEPEKPAEATQEAKKLDAISKLLKRISEPKDETVLWLRQRDEETGQWRWIRFAGVVNKVTYNTDFS